MQFPLRTFFLCVCFVFAHLNAKAQYKYKIIVDNNQIWESELEETARLKCDGAWSIPGNSAGNKGRDIPVSKWKVGYNGLSSDLLMTEDYWKNFPAKNFDLTADIVGKNNIHLACGYAEPSIENDPHTTSVINDDVIDNIYEYAGVPVVVLARAHIGKWKTEVTRALHNSKVAGVCYEQKPIVSKYTQWDLVNGIKAVLAQNKMVFLLLPPQFASDSKNYTSDIVNVFNYLKSTAPDVLMDSNLYFVPNCYNRLKDKTTTFYGGDDSVEGAIKKLKELRGDFNTATQAEQRRTAKIYPNPFNKQVNIECPDKAHYQVQIFDLAGKHIFQEHFTSKTSIDLPEVKPGIYLLKISSGNNTTITKTMLCSRT